MYYVKMNKRNYIITFLIILAITFGIYSNSLKNEFINYWDDNTYVTENDLIKTLRYYMDNHEH